MGLFSSKKTGHSLGEDSLSGMDPREIAKLPKKQQKALQDQVNRASGKTKGSSRGDISAAFDDIRNGRSSSRATTPPPQPRKGRSMWGKDTPLK